MRWMALLLGCLVGVSAHAADTSVMVQAGRRGNTESAGIGLRLGPFWTTEWGSFHVTAHPEFEVNRHRFVNNRGPASNGLWQAGAFAMLRVAYGQTAWRPYLEVGLGANYISKTKMGSQRYGTHFQFGEHLGLGIESRNGFFAGWRLTHYSNADITNDNNGIDTNQVVVGMSF